MLGLFHIPMRGRTDISPSEAERLHAAGLVSFSPIGQGDGLRRTTAGAARFALDLVSIQLKNNGVEILFFGRIRFIKETYINVFTAFFIFIALWITLYYLYDYSQGGQMTYRQFGEEFTVSSMWGVVAGFGFVLLGGLNWCLLKLVNLFHRNRKIAAIERFLGRKIEIEYDHSNRT